MTVKTLQEAAKLYIGGLIGPIEYKAWVKHFTGPLASIVTQIQEEKALGGHSWVVPPGTKTFTIDSVTSVQEELMASIKSQQSEVGKALKAQAKAAGVPDKSATAVLEPEKATDQCYQCKQPFCDVCTLCHTEGCMLFEKAVTSKSQLIELNHLMAQTQKARGFVLLAGVLNVPKPYFVVTEQSDIEVIAKKLDGNNFVRPCPIRPRHGFVDSRPLDRSVGTPWKDQLDKIYAEAKAADPGAELLISPTINATHNLILTPSRMAIGTGHDGATGGRGSISVPLMGVPFKEIAADFIKKAGVGEDEDPYIECVVKTNADAAYHGNGPESTIFFTQLRAGVRVPANVGNDYIPIRMIVKKVVEASGDLLEWERQAQTELGQEGTVVVHVGGTLISHYGVHCLFNKIPILTTRKPEVGEVLVPTPKAEKPSLDAVRDGLIDGWGPYIGLRVNLKDPEIKGAQVQLIASNAVALMLVCLHNAAAMSGEYGYWIGIAATMMMRLGMAASHGESRHKDHSGKKYSREYIYMQALNDPEAARETLGFAQWRFHNEAWSSSYGGPKWADCTKSILELDIAVRAFLKDPTEETLAKVVSTLNYAVTRAHNGGWWMNKFCDQRVFDDGCGQSMYSLAASAPAMLGIKNIQQKRTTDMVDKWRDAAEIVEQNPAKLIEPPKKRDEEVPPPDKGCGQENCWDCYPPKDYLEQIAKESAGNKAVPTKTPVKPTESTVGEKLLVIEYGSAGGGKSEVLKDAAAKLDYLKKSKSIFEPPKPATKSGNVNNITPAPENPVVASAQARILLDGTTTHLHMQFKLQGVMGYYSSTFQFKIDPNKAKPVPSWNSLAGSGESYFPLHASGTDHPDVKEFSNGQVAFKLNVRIRQLVTA